MVKASQMLYGVDKNGPLWRAFESACWEAGYASAKSAANECLLWDRTWLEAMHYVTSPPCEGDTARTTEVSDG